MSLPLSRAKRVAARAMLDLGISERQIAQELEISKTSAHNLSRADDLDPGEVEAVKAQIQSRLVMASDRFLTQALDHIQELGPYQAILCAGITHDHYLRSRMADRGMQGGAGGLTQILIQIDQRTRGQMKE